ncbi:MAG: VWA domain-containing protein [Acidobacteriota bacterium]|nr:VWA domain-containing protein [Acidobacteriota bacterium]
MSSTIRANIVAIVCLLICVPPLNGQTPQQTNRPDQSDVLRVYTELVQTDVMVFDNQGRFANGLQREDFELRIDGKQKSIEFFEKITAGSVSEESQLSAARGSSRPNPKGPGPIPLDRGRPIYFYVDDLHLELQSLKTTQKLITYFIDQGMGQNDSVAITSASGQIGFLQQLTDNKAVLRAAVGRIKFRPYAVRDNESPRMTEYQSSLVDNNDRDVIEYFVSEVTSRNPGISREMAESMVKNRARVALIQAANVTRNTLTGLESLVRSANVVPSRKLVFFISDGFFLDPRNSDSISKLREITSAAARNGVVIYSMDSRGLVAELSDPSRAGVFDQSLRLLNSSQGEMIASQHGLSALANDTGGKAFFNKNSLEPALAKAVKETSSYYLLAWKPERDTQKPGKFRRIEVRLVGKPDLRAQVRRGFFDLEPEGTTAAADKSSKTNQQRPTEKIPESDLRKVIGAAYPKQDLPVALRLSYVHAPKHGELLSTTVQLPIQFLSFEPVKEKQTAFVTLTGAVFDDKGTASGAFSERASVSATSLNAEDGGQNLVYSHSLYLKPGLYQVRVAARDEKSGRSGSAHGWLEIPNLSSGELTLSSLLIGGRAEARVNNASTTEGSAESSEPRLSNQFALNEFLRFLVFVYNATPSTSDTKPDLAVQVQVVRDGQPVITAPLKTISLEGVEDFKNIPYAAEVSLAGLPRGQYVLQVAVVDRMSKRSASQQTRFEIQ